MVNLLNVAIDSIPESWIFEYYCNLEKPLEGQRQVIKSIFQTSDRRPSMYIYYRYGRYIYKDFASGNGGSAVNLVSKLFNISEKEAITKIVTDFMKVGEYKHSTPIVEETPAEVISYRIRNWFDHDKKYWLKFNIGLSILNRYCVKPIAEFILQKDTKQFKFQGLNTYGYFKEDGTLCKIYQPYNKTCKFIWVNDFFQGAEQLENKKHLILSKSLKDIMSLSTITRQFDFLAVDSENTMLNKTRLSVIKHSYQSKYVLFDNDEPGQRAAKRYVEQGFINIPWSLHKDTSEAIDKAGYENTKKHFVKLIKSLI
jgi:hypothetical protein